MTRGPWLRVAACVFITLMGSYAFFWHSRDWNTASRLILAYALVDRHTVCLDGLDRQTGDIAFHLGHYYCDKLPGFSFMATVPYAIVGRGLGLGPHPLNGPALAYWPADYWTTLGTSGLFTAITALLLMSLARGLGCSPRAGAVVGLAYGLATPAFVYATLAYGHQLSAFALLASFLLLLGSEKRHAGARMAAAGFLAAFAPVIELQVGPVAAILGMQLLGQCLLRRRRPRALAYFAIGAAGPSIGLLLYNMLAFGSPWEMGYFHHATSMFARVHNAKNPLGLTRPDWRLVRPLLWGGYRGLLYYAPILLLSVPGWGLLVWKRHGEEAIVSLAACLAVFVVNLSYPEWTGGWSTGPRLLVPLLPFAMVPVAGWLAFTGDRRGGRLGAGLAIALAGAGGLLMILFQGVGARIPQFVADPLVAVLLPFWCGDPPLPRWWPGDRFARNLVSLGAGQWLSGLEVHWQAIQFAPLALWQALGVLAVYALGAERRLKSCGDGSS